MFKKYNFVVVIVALAVIAVTVYKGSHALIGYIEGKAVTEVAKNQLEEKQAVIEESAELTVKLNAELDGTVDDLNVSMDKIINNVDLLLAERQANPVELPVTIITGKAPVVRETGEGKVAPVTKPIVVEVDALELTLAWKAFCQIRPSYKACLEGTHP